MRKTLSKLSYPAYLPYYEFQESKIFWIELAKAIYFFQFIEQDKMLGAYLNDFLSAQKGKELRGISFSFTLIVYSTAS